MAFDYKGLLRSLASGDQGDVADKVLARRQNGPLTIQLTPGQQAAADMVSGAQQAASDAAGFTNRDSLPPNVVQPTPDTVQSNGLFSGNQPPTITTAPTPGQPDLTPSTVLPPTDMQNRPATSADDIVNSINTIGTDNYSGGYAGGASDGQLIGPTYGAYNQQQQQNQQQVQPGGLFKTPVDAQTAKAQQAYVAALTAPIVKQSLWKDIGAKTIGATNAFVKGFRGDPNIEPAYGWGKIKHDNAVRQAAGVLAPLQQQQQYETQRQEQGLYRTAQAAKNRADAQEQQARITHMQNQDAANGVHWTQQVRNGKYYKHFDDGHEEPLTDEKGVQESEYTKTPEYINQQNAAKIAAAKLVGDRQIAIAQATNNREYQNKLVDIRLKALEANGSLITNTQEMLQHGKDLQDIANQKADVIQKIQDLDPDELDTLAKTKELQGQLKELDTQFNTKRNAFDAALGKTTGGTQVLKELQKIKVAAPQDVTKLAGTGKPVSKANDPKNLYQ